MVDPCLNVESLRYYIESKRIFSFLPALYHFKFLEKSDKEIHIISKKVMPLIEGDLIFDINYSDQYIHFRRSFHFSLMINEPEIFQEKYFRNLFHQDISMFHICNIYQYVIGKNPRRISYLTLLRKAIVNEPFNYEEFPEFPEDSHCNLNGITPFDLLMRYKSILNFSDDPKTLEYTAMSYIKKIERSLKDKQLIENSDQSSALIAYLLIQILIETGNYKNFREFILNFPPKREDNFITENRINEAILLNEKSKDLNIFIQGKYRKLCNIYKVLMFKSYLENPTDEKLVNIVRFLKTREYKHIEFHQLLIATMLVDMITRSSHLPLLILFWRS